MATHFSIYSFIFLICFSTFGNGSSGSDDIEALLDLKSSIDPFNSLEWSGKNVCKWSGVKQCLQGRVTKLVLEHLNLSGNLDERSLNKLDQLRVLSFKNNSLSGQIPSLSGLANLKSLFLNQNNFSGEFPATISGLHRLKVVVLSQNQISGEIPASVVNIRRLYVLYVEDNLLTGPIPGFNQTGLRFLNVSNNQLYGEIPATPALVRFNLSSFSGNVELCGEQINVPCNGSLIRAPPALSPKLTEKKHRKNKKVIWVVVGSVGGVVLLCILVGLLVYFMKKRGGNETRDDRSKAVSGGETAAPLPEEDSGGGGGNKGGGFNWEGDSGIGTLVFCGAGDQQMNYSLEDLLKASAETLGRGTMGSTYKAVMESGFIVTVKRLKDARYPRVEEFRRHMEVIGKLRHPNLVPIRAYFQAKEERLLVFDYFPNGSLFSLIHGSRTSAGGKPLHWTSCLKIAEDLATGLNYIHQNPGLTHGNLKSSNVLLGSDFESCLTDYCLTTFRNPDSAEESSASALFYRAPEYRDTRRPLSQQADVYSFGVILLELLTGKTPFQDLVQEHGADIPRWVRSVREEETESGDDPASSNEGSEEKLAALLNISMACVTLTPDNRPEMRDVLRMIKEARAEAQVSSNSSDHSPGRWSDTVQSLPRDDHLSI
ncbi:Inactive leucine-rich repeat receptor-like serine/threonine-protein kinase [Heracleum sosnowskyi]|uniref:Inactive leucine-rich repeat receptor-like serine/threonine-protein kinase n=1 Tax=Heracleum sosnowskyi TaxID=360622 RepID=A0AAD8ITK7_9APIA|nr:Inactive leucine-rich repeat receptor-like serine/threonine-protein kinase [Heracleum sosnowskyi]